MHFRHQPRVANPRSNDEILGLPSGPGGAAVGSRWTNLLPLLLDDRDDDGPLAPVEVETRHKTKTARSLARSSRVDLTVPARSVLRVRSDAWVMPFATDERVVVIEVEHGPLTGIRFVVGEIECGFAWQQGHPELTRALAMTVPVDDPIATDRQAALDLLRFVEDRLDEGRREILARGGLWGRDPEPYRERLAPADLV